MRLRSVQGPWDRKIFLRPLTQVMMGRQILIPDCSPFEFLRKFGVHSDSDHVQLWSSKNNLENKYQLLESLYVFGVKFEVLEWKEM